MKQAELQRCAICHKGVMHQNNITFYRVSIERMVIDLGAVRRQHGLEMMISGPIAAVMGPDEDIAKTLGKSKTAFVCETCALEKSLPLAVIS